MQNVPMLYTSFVILKSEGKIEEGNTQNFVKTQHYEFVKDLERNNYITLHNLSLNT